MKSGAFFIGIFIMAITLVSCGQAGTNGAVVLLSVGNVVIKGEGGDSNPAKAGQALHKSDVIITGPKSHVSIQLSDIGIIQITQNSTIKAVSFFEDKSCEFFLVKGKAMSRIDKLGKGSSYQIKTPTAIAAVRGTAFSVAYGDEASTIAVAKGTVQVIDAATGKEGFVSIGKAADVKSGIRIRDISGVEKLEIDKVEMISIEKGPLGGEQSLTEKTDGYLPQLDVIDEEIEAISPASLTKIREKFGRIDVVTLYSGMVYRGAILSRGGMLNMITPQGKISIPANKVKTTHAQ